MRTRILILVAVAFVTVGRAQIGEGWALVRAKKATQIETHDKYTDHPYALTIVKEAGGSYERTNGVEIFKLFNHDVSNRVEVKDEVKWKTGQRQFEGELRVTAPTDNESCVQIFGRAKVDGNGGPICMVRHVARDGGTLYLSCNNSGTDLVTGIEGKWVRVNIIHNPAARMVTVYINGEKKGEFPTAANDPAGQYFKYGCYGTLKTESAQIEWRNVKFFNK
jgi:hypothetical protein